MALITTTKLSLLTCVFFSLSLVAVADDAPNTSCTPEIRSEISKKLADYLAKPESKFTKSLTKKLCQISPNGENPCPINITEERVVDFEIAGNKTAEVVPVIACAAALSEGAETEELNDLQANLLDHYGPQFFGHWQQIPKEMKSTAQKFEDFATLTPTAIDDDIKKKKVLKNRIEVLKKAPAALKKDVAAVLETLANDMGYSSGGREAIESEKLAMKVSKFREIMTDKLIRFKSPDEDKIVFEANEVARIEGLNYKPQLRSSSRSWNLCSINGQDLGSCHLSDVDLETGKNSCGDFARLAVMAQSPSQWVVTTGASTFRINSVDLFNAPSITLEKSETVARSWVVPVGFQPEFIDDDLHTVYFKSTLMTDNGKRLATLHLEVLDIGRARFVKLPKDHSKLVQIRKSGQNVKNPDGTTYQVVLPKNCR